MAIGETELGPVIGHADAMSSWRKSLSAGRHHHAWLLQGVRGVGKARLALQFAANLLDQSLPAGAASPDTSTGRLMLAGSHPDFRLLRRTPDEKGKLRKDIPIDDVRELISFLSLGAGLDGWRVAIIDALDELNRNGLNALLKTLEEPPRQTVLLLISHGEAPMLATIRSRCRVLRIHPLSEADTTTVLTRNGVHAGQIDTLVQLAPGRPGRALSLSGPDTQEAAETVRTALRSLPAPGAEQLSAILSKAGSSDSAFRTAMHVIVTSIQKRALREADPVSAAGWADLALRIARVEHEALDLSMDRGQTILSTLRKISEHAAVRTGA